MKFEELKIVDSVLEILKENNYIELTPIQEKVIPFIENGSDIIGCSQTGSGKTFAFLLPILSKLIENKQKKAIVVSPTRELAIQIMENVKLLTQNIKKFRKALLIGGASIREQLVAVNSLPQIIVGTPGRINDFLESGRLKIHDFSMVVLDEMDRMLDMGFSTQIDKIIENIKCKRQTMLFSATMSKKIEKVAEKYLNNPKIVKIGEVNSVAKNVSEEIIEVENNKKFDVLLEKLRENTIFCLIFVKTKLYAEKLAEKLDKANILVKAIHGDIKQSKRAKIIEDFKNKKFNVLVATDVVARGLDIHHIDSVINYDLPQSPEDYIHRIGRCSRGLNSVGKSITFCSSADRKKLEAIQSLLKNGDYDDKDLGYTKTKNKPNSQKPKQKNIKKENMKENITKKSKKDNKNKNVKKVGSGYDIDSLMSGGNKNKVKRKGTYFVD